MMEDIRWDNLYRVLNEYADFFVREAQDRIQSNGNIATGTLNETMGVEREISFENDYLSVKISLEDYWKYLENGTAPHRPPFDAIRNWVEVKFSLPDEEVNNVAWAVVKGIEKNGTAPHPFIEDSKNVAFAQFEDAIGYAIEEDMQVYFEETALAELASIL